MAPAAASTNYDGMLTLQDTIVAGNTANSHPDISGKHHHG